MAIITRSPAHRKRQLNRHQHTCVNPESAPLYYDEWSPDLPSSPRSDGDSTTATSETIVLGRSRSLYSKKPLCVHCIRSSSSSSSSKGGRWRNVLQHTLHTMTPDQLDLHNYQFFPGQTTTTGYHQSLRCWQQQQPRPLHFAQPQSTTPTHSPTIAAHASLNMDQPSSSLQIELGGKDTMDSLSPPTKKRRKITMILPPQPKHRMTLRSARNK